MTVPLMRRPRRRRLQPGWTVRAAAKLYEAHKEQVGYFASVEEFAKSVANDWWDTHSRDGGGLSGWVPGKQWRGGVYLTLIQAEIVRLAQQDERVD